eukprot:TRINITY_DN11133_c0_g1_i2.p1 TRINITY_DN11133_c0_g1~~TRINITY_DN11133_c0_g1_i2.p1  ORF type:complete len:101 (+),score=5.23 TRINITY_DN11133_c0_g1_i2:31-303(+)
MLHVGLPQGRVAESARYCLDQAAQACGHASASDMVTANADYLINDAILRIRSGHVSRYNDILTAVLDSTCPLPCMLWLLWYIQSACISDR